MFEFYSSEQPFLDEDQTVPRASPVLTGGGAACTPSRYPELVCAMKTIQAVWRAN